MATVTIPAIDLQRAAAWAKPDPTDPLPILANVKVTVTGGQLVLAVYDWETLLLAPVPGTGWDGATASVLVPAGPFAEAVKTLRGQVEATVAGTTLDLVTCAGTVKAHRLSVVQDCDPDAYPAIPATMPEMIGWADGDVFGPAALAVAGCCAPEAELPLIRAVHFVPGRGPNREVLGLEGTNRSILGLHQVGFNPGAEVRDVLIPAPLVTRFVQWGIQAARFGPVFLGSDAGQVMLADPWHVVVTQPPYGDYPQIGQIAAKAAAAPVLATVEADTRHIREALTAARETLKTHLDGYAAAQLAEVDADKTLKSESARNAAKTDRRRHVYTRRGRGMFLAVDGKTPCGAELFAVHPFTGEELGRWPLPAVCEGEAVTCSLNPEYLAALLPEDGTVLVHLPGGLKALRITVAGSAWEGVIMPINDPPPAPAENTETDEELQDA